MADAKHHEDARLEILDALVAAVADVPSLVEVVLGSSSRPDAAARLRERYGFSEAAADAVLSMPLYRLMPLYRDSLADERATLAQRLQGLTQSDSSNERGSAGG